jgi:YfiR/HmsC-like
MFRPLVIIVILLLGTTSIFSLEGDDQLDNSNTVVIMKSHYLFNFANSNSWPDSYRKGKFYIGILGNNALYDDMASRYGNKPVGNQVIEVVNLLQFDSRRFMHVLYIDKTKKADMPRIVKELKGESTLFVSSFEGGVSAGADINFKTVEDNIRYELNKTSMENKKITPGIKIMQSAIK